MRNRDKRKSRSRGEGLGVEEEDKMATVEIYGAQKLMARLVRLEKALDPAAIKGVKEVAKAIRDDAKEMCPVDTGSLQKSIRVGAYAKPAGHTHSVRVTAGGHVTNPKSKRKVDYASYVEFGTSKQRSQPFMRPAIVKHRRDLAKAIKEAIRE